MFENLRLDAALFPAWRDWRDGREAAATWVSPRKDTGSRLSWPIRRCCAVSAKGDGAAMHAPDRHHRPVSPPFFSAAGPSVGRKKCNSRTFMTTDRHDIPPSDAPGRDAVHVHRHDHAAPRAVALGPSWSLMRLSAWQPACGRFDRGRRALGDSGSPGRMALIMAAAIQFDDVTLGYGRHPAVHHLDGAIKRGSLTAVCRAQRRGKIHAAEGDRRCPSPPVRAYPHARGGFRRQ